MRSSPSQGKVKNTHTGVNVTCLITVNHKRSEQMRFLDRFVFDIDFLVKDLPWSWRKH